MCAAQTCLSTRWLCEPQSPLVHQGVLDVEVIFVMEYCDLLFARTALSVGILVLIVPVCTVGRDWNSREIDR